METFKDFLFIFQKDSNPQNELFGLHDWKFDLQWAPEPFCNDVRAEYFAKGTENFKIVRNSFKREERNLVYHACRKTQELGESDKEIWTSSSYPFRHKTTVQFALQSVGKEVRWLDNAELEVVFFCMLIWIVCVYRMKPFELSCFFPDLVLSNWV